MQELHGKLQSITQVIRVRASDVQIIEKPEVFYDCIIEKINNSTKQIILSSLYIGSDSLSQRIVHEFHSST